MTQTAERTRAVIVDDEVALEAGCSTTLDLGIRHPHAGVVQQPMELGDLV